MGDWLEIWFWSVGREWFPVLSSRYCVVIVLETYLRFLVGRPVVGVHQPCSYCPRMVLKGESMFSLETFQEWRSLFSGLSPWKFFYGGWIGRTAVNFKAIPFGCLCWLFSDGILESGDWGKERVEYLCFQLWGVSARNAVHGSCCYVCLFFEVAVLTFNIRTLGLFVECIEYRLYSRAWNLQLRGLDLKLVVFILYYDLWFVFGMCLFLECVL